ncbi:Hsp90 cochaperone shq1 [Phlyctochytrium bullatum]|nr:Hsp90 cochaperone shq1 [Phlyctochytrium bullatum]
MFVDGLTFKFYVNPYLLSLTFPHPVVEDGRESAKYDVAKGIVTVNLPKLVKGTHFPNLQMLSTLIAPKGPKPSPAIEVLGGDSQTGYPTDFDMDWNATEALPVSELVTAKNSTYGFNQAYSGFESQLREIGRGILEIDDLDQSTVETRRAQRSLLEDDDFSAEHYAYDFANDEEIQRLIKFKPQSWMALKRIQSASKTRVRNMEPAKGSDVATGDFHKDEPKPIYLGLVDILFAYCYDHRITEGEHNVESPWTIAKIAATLSCLEVYRLQWKTDLIERASMMLKQEPVTLNEALGYGHIFHSYMK